MAEYKLSEIEMKFAELIWRNELIPSGELASCCLKELKRIIEENKQTSGFVFA